MNINDGHTILTNQIVAQKKQEDEKAEARS
jgi:hypothetical protein